MLIRIGFFAALLAACSSLPVQAQDSAASATGWTVLFDGTSTDAFRNYQEETLSPKWKVIDGALVRSDKGAGDIITKDKFGAFELELDYKISPAGNSGIMYHVTEDNPKPWHSGPEIQIQDNSKGHDPQKSGWLYQLYKSEKDATNPAGQWNKLRIVITPDKCEHHVNGVKYFEYVKGSDDWDQRVAASKFSKFENFGEATSGHIALQDHGNEVAFRDIRIRRLQ